MKINKIQILCRSAAFELESDQPYFYPEPYEVRLDHTTIYQQRRSSVFSLFSLEPSREYVLEVTTEGGQTQSLAFTTAAESYLFDAAACGLSPRNDKDNTAQLQAALMACPAGGTVRVPAGTYRIQSLFLPSDITLYLDKGCTLLGGTAEGDYPLLPGVIPNTDARSESYLGTEKGISGISYSGMLNVIGSSRVVIAGEGIIDTNGKEQSRFQTAQRPSGFFSCRAQDVTIHGVQFLNSCSRAIHPTSTDGLNLLDLSVENAEGEGDGIDPDACSQVHVIGCRIRAGEDCISLKSGGLFLGRKRHKSCQRILIRCCLLQDAKWGVTLGSDLCGGIRGVDVERCLIRHIGCGVGIKTRRGNGSGAVIDGLTLFSIKMESVKQILSADMYYALDSDGSSSFVQSRTALPVDESTPWVGEICLDQVEASGTTQPCILMAGLPERPIQSLNIRHVQAVFARRTPGEEPAAAFQAENVKRICLEDLKLSGFEGERLLCRGIGRMEEDGQLMGTVRETVSEIPSRAESRSIRPQRFGIPFQGTAK